MKTIHALLILILILSGSSSSAQTVGVTLNPDSLSVLDSNVTSQGSLPRISNIQRDLIVNPAFGLIIYNTTTNDIEINFSKTNIPNWTNSKAKGLNGTQGIQGLTGATGNTGATGVSGTNGINGSIGLTGSQGISGKNGAVGITGARGNTGANGTKGSIGLTGSVGAKGNPGISGSNGTEGAKGSQGIQGLKGVAGTNGIDGALGFTGARGYTGLSGSNGTNGSDGATGLTGADGNNGIQGAAGSNGSTGLTGATGSNGSNGTNGIDGIQGIQGIQGVIGSQGNPGATGAKGANGFTGAAGANGLTGLAVASAADFPQLNQNTSGTAAAISGINLPMNGGSGVANNNASTLTLNGAFATRITTTAPTNITLPASGLLYSSTVGSINSSQMGVSLSDESGTGAMLFSNSPVLSGIPTAPKAAVGTNSNQLATTSFVMENSGGYGSVDGTGTISTSSSGNGIIAGMSESPEPGTYMVLFNSQYSINPKRTEVVVSTSRGIADLENAYTQIIGKAVTDASHPSVFGSGEVVFPGVYTITGAMSIAGTLTLDGKGDSNSVFIFRSAGAFNTSKAVTIVLKNRASACNIFWLAEGAVSLGDGTIMKGTLIAHGAGLAVGAETKIEGRMFATAGAIAFGPGTITAPANCSYINLGILDSFVTFTAGGGLGNKGASVYNGDIATGVGVMTGFETAIVNGTVFPASEDTTVTTIQEATANFGLYKNGVLIPNSNRSRNTKVNTADISLQAICTITEGQTVDVRWNVDAGTVSLENRILSLIKIK